MNRARGPPQDEDPFTASKEESGFAVKTWVSEDQSTGISRLWTVLMRGHIFDAHLLINTLICRSSPRPTFLTAVGIEETPPLPLGAVRSPFIKSW